VIRRSPAENYLKFLIVHPDNYADASIRSLVIMQQLDWLGMPYLTRLRSVCVPPTPFYPEDRQHLRSIRFLRKERLESIFHPDDEMEGAVKILESARAKELVETMLISNSHPAWVCTALRRQVAMDVVEGAIVRYKHYYFNVDLVDSSELKALMAMRLSSEESTDVDEQKTAAALVSVLRNDSRRIASMAATPLTANITNMLRMGLLPSSVDIARLAEATRTAAISGGLDMAIRGLPTQGRDFALMAKMMTEILESIGDPANDLQEGLARLSIETENQDIPNLKQLSAGSHTLNIQPIDVPAEVEASE
jgi:hypothetical protein